VEGKVLRQRNEIHHDQEAERARKNWGECERREKNFQGGGVATSSKRKGKAGRDLVLMTGYEACPHEKKNLGKENPGEEKGKRFQVEEDRTVGGAGKCYNNEIEGGQGS